MAQPQFFDSFTIFTNWLYKNEVWGFNPSFFCWRANQTYDLFNLSE